MRECKECRSEEATEGNGMCFDCSEELAYILADCAREFGILSDRLKG